MERGGERNGWTLRSEGATLRSNRGPVNPVGQLLLENKSNQGEKQALSLMKPGKFSLRLGLSAAGREPEEGGAQPFLL